MKRALILIAPTVFAFVAAAVPASALTDRVHPPHPPTGLERTPGSPAVGVAAIPVVGAKQQTSPSTVACQYFSALFGPDAAGRDKAVELAAPGSIAHAYAVHLAAYMAIQRAEGGGQQPNRVRCSASKVETGKAPEKSKNPPVTYSITALTGTSTYARFATDANGKLTNFTVNGSSLDGSIIEGTAPAVEALGAGIRVVSAYQVAGSGDLYVILELTGSPDGSRDLQPDFSTFYVSALGTRFSTRTQVGDPSLSEWVGPSALHKGEAPVKAYAKFPAQPLGGTLNMTVASNEFNEVLNETVLIPIG